MSRFHCLRSLALPLALLVALPALPLAAQQPGATLLGRVIDDETGDPIPQATVRIRNVARLFESDSSGRFTADGLPLGELEVSIAALGYVPLRVKVFLQSEGRATERAFTMEFSGDKLPDIVVTSRAQRLAPRYMDFERRRERGLGAYFRWDELKQRGFNTVGDALRTVRGVRIVCDQRNFECNAVMSRTPNCPPEWWIDGVNVRTFTENTPIRDIYGIEIYRGPGEVPGEFAGSNAGCGVIAMWTKSRPFR